MAILLKSKREIALMQKSADLVAKVLSELKHRIKPGVTTGELDAFAENLIRKHSAVPGFKGLYGYPATLCTSIDNEIIHGIPSRKRKLKAGQIIGVDVGVVLNGYYGDAAFTYPVGEISDEAAQLLRVTRQALHQGIAKSRIGNRLFDISHAVQSYAESFGYSVVRDFVGHGIGRSLHEEPKVPNYGNAGEGLLLKPGLVIAIEPMINIGEYDVKVKNDNWTAVTKDGSLSAHFEHTIAITENGPLILTKKIDENLTFDF